MNTKHLANHFDTDGEFQPIYFIDNSPTFKDLVLELALGMAALVAFVCFIILVSAL